MKKRLISIVVMVCMVAAFFSGLSSVPAASVTLDELQEKVYEGLELYYSCGSEQTTRNLRNKIGIAQMLINGASNNASKINDAYTSLNTAISQFVPINNISRSEINGIEYWTEEQIADMEVSGANVSLNTEIKAEQATKSLKFELNDDKAFFSNKHTLDGVFSPFGQDMNDAAGIAFWISSNDYGSVDTIDLYVGKKDLNTDDVLSSYDIPVSKEGYVYVSWDYFYPEYNNLDAKLDLSGGMNYIAFAIHGSSNAIVYISDIHAYVAGVEDDKRDYQEVLISSIDEIKRDAVYKIVDADTGLYLTFGPLASETEFRSESRIKFTESKQKFSLENNFGEDVTQQWQIYKMMKHDKYTITNQGTAAGMTINGLGLLTLDMHSDLENAAQMWDVICVEGHFKFRNVNSKNEENYIGIVSGIPCLTKNSDTEWMLYECIREEWVQVWGDEFNDGMIDRTKWNVNEGHTRGDTEPEYFRDDPNNYWFEDGSLVIRSAVEDYMGYHATSASFDTQGIYALTYGKIEVRCKLTEEANYWPAFWSMGQYGNWPQNGELDMMEFDSDGGDSYYNYAPYFTNHWWNFDKRKNIAKGSTIYTEGHEWLSKDYHTFTCEWDATQARSYLDGQLVMSLLFNTDEQRWSFGDNPHYFIMYVSMKGSSGCAVKPGTDPEAKTYFDYVRIYKRGSEVAEVPAYNDKVIKGENITPGNTGWSMCLDKSPDGKYIASTSRFKVDIIDSATDKVVKSLTDPSDEISCLKFSSDSSKLLVADRLGSIRIYRTDTWELLMTKRCTGLYPQSAVFTNDNRYIFVGGRNSSDSSLPDDTSLYVVRYSLTDPSDSGKKIYTGSNARNIKLSPDGTKLAVACANGKVYIFDDLLYTVFTYAQFNEHERCVRGLDWSPDGKSLVSADEVGVINVYDVEGKTLRFKAKNPSTASITSASYSPDGTKILVNGSADNARLFNAENGKQISVFGGFGQGVATAQWSKDGSKILLMSREGYGRIYDSDCNYLVTLDGRLQYTAMTHYSSYCIHESLFNDDATKVYGITYEDVSNTYRWNVSYTETDYTEFEKALKSVSEIDAETISDENYEKLIDTVDKYKRLNRFYGVSQSDLDTATLSLTAAIKIAVKGGIIGIEPWNTNDASGMTANKCKATMNLETIGEKQINTLRVYTTGKAWEMNNISSKDGTVIKNPFGSDLRDYSGLTITAYANKDVTDSDIYIGYIGTPENTIYKYNIGVLKTTPTEYKIPFESFVRVSGDEKLDLSKLEIFGLTGSGKASTAVYYCNLDAYQNEGEIPVITGVENGDTFDLRNGTLKVEWNVGRGELNGDDCTSGIIIDTIGNYTLKVINLDKRVTITFNVVDTTPTLLGDINEDEKISIVDAMMALRIAAELIDDPTNGNADITEDGFVTIEDALTLLRICVRLPQEVK